MVWFQVGSTDGRIYASECWHGRCPAGRYPKTGKPAIGAVYASPGVAGNMIYVGSDDGRIYALKDTTGIQLGPSPATNWGIGSGHSPVFVDGIVYATSGGAAMYPP